MTSAWDPDQYERFVKERRQPFHDLMALVEPGPMRVLDLGCGTGELTRAIHRELGAMETLGVDSSETMLARSAAFVGDGVRFEQADIATIQSKNPYDLIFSNAALHWLPEHEELISRISDMVARDGQLAIQVPTNDDHPSHWLTEELAGSEPFATALGGFVQKTPVLDPRRYSELLYRLGFRRQFVKLQIYGHELESAQQIVEWVKGTLLTVYQRRLSEEMFADFVDTYRERLTAELGKARPFFYTYKRVLMWAADPRR